MALTPEEKRERYDAIVEELEEVNDEAILFDGYEAALVGVCERFGQSTLALYDYDLCIAILRKRDGMSDEEAREFFDFNTIGAWAGSNTPAFCRLWTKD